MALSLSTPDDKAAFLAGCMNKTKSVRDVFEHLGLFCQRNDLRRDPDFLKNEANELHTRVKKIAQAFRASHRNDSEDLRADLAKQETFSNDIRDLEHQYGQAIWGRATAGQSRSIREQDRSLGELDELDWYRSKHRETIRFLIRCWIVRLAVTDRSTTPRKRNGKGKSRRIDLSDGEVSDSSGSSDIPYCAPEPPRMYPASENRGEHGQAADLRLQNADTPACTMNVNHNSNMEIETGSPSKRHFPCTPSKRKVVDNQGQHSTGKLQKISKETQTMPVPQRVSQQDLYTVPRSPTLPLIAARFPNLPEKQRQRESTHDTDATYMPPPRGVTMETETVVDGDEVAADAIDLIIPPLEEGMQYRYHDEPTAGPSGTYRNPRRKDSVIPDTQNVTAQALSAPAGGHSALGRTMNTRAWSGATNMSQCSSWQEKEYRRELFKLLLSYLNSIRQFIPDAYDTDAEDRMNHLLEHFWVNDKEITQAKLGNDFERMRTAWTRWVNMRRRLAAFQISTGYFGHPGEQWREHLRRMRDIPARAQACIAFVELKGHSSEESKSRCGTETFNEDLATVFDLLTKVEGCNGAEEFQGVRLFNEALLEWFKEEERPE